MCTPFDKPFDADQCTMDYRSYIDSVANMYAPIEELKNLASQRPNDRRLKQLVARLNMKFTAVHWWGVKLADRLAEPPQSSQPEPMVQDGCAWLNHVGASAWLNNGRPSSASSSWDTPLDHVPTKQAHNICRDRGAEAAASRAERSASASSSEAVASFWGRREFESPQKDTKDDGTFSFGADTEDSPERPQPCFDLSLLADDRNLNRDRR